MTPSLLAPWQTGLLETAAYLGVCLQVIHVVTAASMQPKGERLPVVVTGVGVALHLALSADLLAGLSWRLTTVLADEFARRGMLPMLWLNVALFAVVGVQAIRMRNRASALFAGLMLLSVPPVASALGGWWNLACALDLAAFLGLSAAQLRSDARRRREGPTQASVAEAMKVLSVGMLVTDGRGGSVFMNDAMRHQLEDLGLPTDLGDLSDVWDRAREHAVSLEELGVRSDVPLPSELGAGDDRILVRRADGRVILGMIERPSMRGRGTRAFSLDVTQLVEAERELSLANAELARVNAEMVAQLVDVQAVSRQVAFLRMRAAVHDVIGQRLSILQRYLESDRVDEASTERLRELMDSVLGDLRDATGGDFAERLDDVVDAFSLVDVDVIVGGELPDDQAVANALVRIVREASTNACRHGQARRVWVRLGEEERKGRVCSTLEVSDDGEPPEGEVLEGTGIPGMRRAAEELGGELVVQPGPPFVVRAWIPLEKPGKKVG